MHIIIEGFIYLSNLQNIIIINVRDWEYLIHSSKIHAENFTRIYSHDMTVDGVK